jgi:hypothetical protein
MSSVNNPNYILDQTVRVFDAFYDYDVNVPAAEYDLVYSFFKREMGDAGVAANFTASLFRVASNTDVPILNLLESLQGTTGMQLTVNMAYYLNNIRSNSTLLGVNSTTTPNYYAARAVVQ